MRLFLCLQAAADGFAACIARPVRLAVAELARLAELPRCLSACPDRGLHNGSGTGVVRIEGAGDYIPNWPNLLMDLSRMAPEKFPPLHGRNMVN